MATATLLTQAVPGRRHRSIDLRGALTLLVCAGLPLGLFGLVNLGAEALDILPFFFAPFGLPGWSGAVLHLSQLFLLGCAMGVLVINSAARPARFWLAGLIGAYILLPFVTPPLDSLQLSILCATLFLFGIATLRRVGAQSGLAGWLMVPMLGVLGFSATMGLVLTAAYTPPFALMQGQNPPAS